MGFVSSSCAISNAAGSEARSAASRLSEACRDPADAALTSKPCVTQAPRLQPCAASL